MRTRSLLVSALGSVLLTGLAITAAAPAHAVTPVQPTRVGSVAPAITVNASTPNTLVVAGHRGQPVTIWTKGTSAMVKRPATSAAVTFTGLLGGRAYDVYVGATKAVRVVTATSSTSVINALAIEPGPIADSMRVRWTAALPKKVDAAKVSTTIRATSRTAPAVELTVTGADQALLTGLRSDAAYTFTVTVRVPGASPSTSTVEMDQTVAEAHADLVQAVAPPAAAPKAVPATATAAAEPTVRTRTITVCPDGYTMSGARCTKTTPYTYTTKAYTYHDEFVVTKRTWVEVPTDYPGQFCNRGGTLYPNGICANEVVEGYHHDVRDATPEGYTDTGSNWSRRDPAPAGFVDDGKQWVSTVDPVTREVAA